LSFGAGIVYIAPYRDRGLALEGLPRDSLELTPASTRLDGSLGYNFKVGNRAIKVSLTGQNLLDRRYLINSSISPQLAPPRTFLVTVDFKN